MFLHSFLIGQKKYTIRRMIMTHELHEKIRRKWEGRGLLNFLCTGMYAHTIHIVFWIFRNILRIFRNKKTNIWLTHTIFYITSFIHSPSCIIDSFFLLDSHTVTHTLHSTLTAIYWSIPQDSLTLWIFGTTLLVCVWRAAAKLLSWSMTCHVIAVITWHYIPSTS